MANASATDTPQVVNMEGKLQHVYGTISVSASPDVYVTGGLALDLSDGSVKASRTPIWIEFTSANGYTVTYVNGSNITNGKLKVLTAANTELAAAAVPANLSGDTIRYHAVFLGQN